MINLISSGCFLQVSKNNLYISNYNLYFHLPYIADIQQFANALIFAIRQQTEEEYLSPNCD